MKNYELANFQPRIKTAEIVVQNADKELLLYNLRTNKAYCLNETSTRIYNLCSGSNSILQIASLLNLTENYVQFAVKQFQENGLLEIEDSAGDYLDAINRRELLQKAALNSAVALPLLTSIIAPRSTNAASVSTPGCGIQNPPSGAPCPPIDCFSACNGGDFTIVIINGCRVCNCVC